MKKIVIAIILCMGFSLAHAEDATHDPYERYNRVMFSVNEKADRYILQPIARGYRAVTPKPVRTAIGNVFNNLRDVVSFGSNILRGDVKGAGHDFIRVSFNTTFGLGGLIDIATAAGIPNNKNTLGDTFATWGWKNSNYFVYPLLGPSTVRDSVGNTLTSLYQPERALLAHDVSYYSATAIKAISDRESLLDLTDGLDAAALDKYAYTRDIFMAFRKQQIHLSSQDNGDSMNEEIDAEWNEVLNEHMEQQKDISSENDINQIDESASDMPIEIINP